MALFGGCRCGTCRYSLDYDQIPVVYACHCLDCQKTTGGGFALQAAVSSSRFHIDGDLIEWRRQSADSGTHIPGFRQRSCANCQTRMFTTFEGFEEMALLSAGTLDRSSEVIPSAHLWAKRRQPWIALPEGVEIYEEGFPGDRAMAFYGPNLV